MEFPKTSHKNGLYMIYCFGSYCDRDFFLNKIIIVSPLILFQLVLMISKMSTEFLITIQRVTTQVKRTTTWLIMG